MSPVVQQAIPPPTLINPTQLAAPVVSTVTADAQKRADQQKKQEELQKKLLEETEPQTLQQQENMSIKGQSARHLVMQKLMRKTEVKCPKFALSNLDLFSATIVARAVKKKHSGNCVYYIEQQNSHMYSSSSFCQTNKNITDRCLFPISYKSVQ